MIEYVEESQHSVGILELKSTKIQTHFRIHFADKANLQMKLATLTIKMDNIAFFTRRTGKNEILTSRGGRKSYHAWWLKILTQAAEGRAGKNFLPSQVVRFFTTTRGKNFVLTHPPGEEHYSYEVSLIDH